MSENSEATGTAAAGAALERGHFAETECLNCGAALNGRFCSECGQAAHPHRTLGAFLHDLAHGVLHLDGKVWRTLPMLAFRPGTLTRNYIDGHRARYVSPMALFLFSVLLVFAVFSLLGISAPDGIAPMTSAREQAESLVGEMEDYRLRLAEELEGMDPADPGREAVEERLARAEADMEDARRLQAGLEQRIGEIPDLVPGAEDAAGGLLAALETKWRKNPGLMLYKMQANSYKFSWLLIPISVLPVWLIFAWKPRFGLYDHAVFVTYSIAFMSLFFILLALAGAAGAPGWLVSAFGGTVPLMHLHGQVKGAYGLSRFSAAWRTVALVFFVLVALSVFVIALALIGAF